MGGVILCLKYTVSLSNKADTVTGKLGDLEEVLKISERNLDLKQLIGTNWLIALYKTRDSNQNLKIINPHFWQKYKKMIFEIKGRCSFRRKSNKRDRFALEKYSE